MNPIWPTVLWAIFLPAGKWLRRLFSVIKSSSRRRCINRRQSRIARHSCHLCLGQLRKAFSTRSIDDPAAPLRRYGRCPGEQEYRDEL